MPKRKRAEPDIVKYFTYRLFYTQHAFPPDIRTESEKILAYAEKHPSFERLGMDHPTAQKLARPFLRLYTPWIREKRATEGDGTREFKEAVDTLTAALADEASQKTRYDRQWIVQCAIDAFNLASEATYTNVDVTDPDDWPFAY